jgi:hypothetical protein
MLDPLKVIENASASASSGIESANHQRRSLNLTKTYRQSRESSMGRRSPGGKTCEFLTSVDKEGNYAVRILPEFEELLVLSPDPRPILG